jgi:hypothetical protein
MKIKQIKIQCPNEKQTIHRNMIHFECEMMGDGKTFTKGNVKSSQLHDQSFPFLHDLSFCRNRNHL